MSEFAVSAVGATGCVAIGWLAELPELIPLSNLHNTTGGAL